MNSGYVIVKEDLSSKISPGTVEYNGAFDYAKQLQRTGKLALIEVITNNFKILAPINMYIPDEGVITWIITSTFEMGITFHQDTPNQFEVTTIGG